jgi:hypothetical protein
VIDNWSFKAAQYFNAEHNHIAQSGACLTECAWHQFRVLLLPLTFVIAELTAGTTRRA